MERCGMRRFHSLEEAIRMGYQVYDRTPEGYLVRIRTEIGYALAIVEVRPERAKL